MKSSGSRPRFQLGHLVLEAQLAPSSKASWRVCARRPRAARASAAARRRWARRRARHARGRGPAQRCRGRSRARPRPSSGRAGCGLRPGLDDDALQEARPAACARGRTVPSRRSSPGRVGAMRKNSAMSGLVSTPHTGRLSTNTETMIRAFSWSGSSMTRRRLAPRARERLDEQLVRRASPCARRGRSRTQEHASVTPVGEVSEVVADRASSAFRPARRWHCPGPSSATPRVARGCRGPARRTGPARRRRRPPQVESRRRSWRRLTTESTDMTSSAAMPPRVSVDHRGQRDSPTPRPVRRPASRAPPPGAARTRSGSHGQRSWSSTRPMTRPAADVTGKWRTPRSSMSSRTSLPAGRRPR